MNIDGYLGEYPATRLFGCIRSWVWGSRLFVGPGETEVTVSFVIAKSRVALTRPLTIPKLELQR